MNKSIFTALILLLISFQVAASVEGEGFITREVWTGISGTNLSSLKGNSNYPDSPTVTDTLSSFEAPSNWTDNYGTRIVGYIHAPVSGNYTFWIATDDQGELWLSTNESAGNKRLIASISGWAGVRNWTRYASQKSASIPLQAGQKYYVEALQKEGGGGDNIAVAWQRPGGSLEVIPGQYLSPYTDTSSSSPLRDPENPANTVNGLDYKYYSGTWNSLPNFDSLSPTKTGVTSNYSLNDREANDYFGFAFDGYINVPSDGTYTFFTSSDDGTKLYIGSTLVVNNDGLHGKQERSGQIDLRAGMHAISVDFFEKTGGEVLEVRYQGPGIGKQSIPNNALYRVNDTAQTYQMSVSNGGGDGRYEAGETVTITADPAPSGQVFDSWVSISGNPSISNVGAETTTLVMPMRDVSVAATYQDDDSSLRDPENPANTINGLDYKYYSGTWNALPNFNNLSPDTEGVASNYSLDDRLANDHFGLAFEGFINVPSNGTYTFFTNSDDGTKLYIGDTLIVNNDGLHGRRERSGQIDLRAGKHAIRVDFFEKTGGEVLEVRYQGPGIGKQLIPDNVLFRVNDVAQTNQVNVTNGSGDGRYEAGETVTITADPAPSGQVFAGWVPTSGNPRLAEPNAVTTTFTMPAIAVNITATYQDDNSNLRTPDNPANTVNGLDYKYFSGTWDLLPNFATLSPVKTGITSNYSLDDREANDHFGFVFTGYVNVPSDGVYTFYTGSDDGTKLYIGNTLVVENDGLHPRVERSGQIGLKAGKHAISVDFFEKTGGEVIDVSYQGPGISKQFIPDNALYRVNETSQNFPLTVNNGSGDGQYVAGTSITIRADGAPSGQVFDRWVINSGNPSIGDVNASTTTLIMPARAASVTASYRTNDTGGEGPAGFTKCTDEGGSCTFTQRVDVAYGANGQFAYKYNVTGTIAFNNSSFGDPIPNVRKAGYFKSLSTNPDVTPPSITLRGSSSMEVSLGSNFSDPGATASDDRDGDITNAIVRTGNVNTSQIGTYQLRYDVGDAAGNSAPTVTRQVSVVQGPDTTAPSITLLGAATMEVVRGTSFNDPGARASDDRDGDITNRITRSGNVNTGTVGQYTLRYNVSDNAGNNAPTVERRVNVVLGPDTTAPSITLLGAATMDVVRGTSFTDPGARASDDRDGDITNRITRSGSVNTGTVGQYTLRYNVSDNAGNNAPTVERRVNVILGPDTTPPVITLLGNPNINIEQGSTFNDPGATASDDRDGNITNRITRSGSVNTNVVGAHTLRYDVTDNAGNSAPTVQRTINVTQAPDTSPSIRVSKSQYQPGESVQISYQNSSNNDDWVGIYRAGTLPSSCASHDSYLTWQYAENTSGTLEFVNLTEGSYVAQMFAEDGYCHLGSSVSFSVTTDGGGPGDPQTGTFEKRIASSLDDVEEGSNGSVSASSTDLELTQDSSNQVVGMRFTGVSIPKNATVTRAYIQFTTDETGSDSTSLTIAAHDVDDAPTFTTSSNNVSSRPTTSATVNWQPGAWSSVGASGDNERTPDIKTVIQEVVSRTGWNSGNDIAIIIRGSGKRTAESYDGSSSQAPLLHVEYSYTGGTPGDGSATVTLNPYRNVDWSSYGQYKANFHTHTTRSDGDERPETVIDSYHSAGYEILSITDHDTITWPWTDYDRNPGDLGMLAVRGDEYSNSHHVNVFYDFSIADSSLESGIPHVQNSGGLCQINHPKRYSDESDWGWYLNWYQNYPACIGIEVVNRNTLFPELWDNINENFLKQNGKMVWGFANDDMHDNSELYRSFQFMLMPNLSEAELKKSKREGAFYFCNEPGGSGNADVPRITNIDVDNVSKMITVNANNYDSITWIGPQSQYVGTGSTFDFSSYPDKSFVRAELSGNRGTCYTQPFGITTN